MNKKPNQPCTLALFNAQSVCNKISEISDFISVEKPDFVLITETWINDNTSFVCAQLTPIGYSLNHVPRSEKRGGGVAIICKSSYQPRIFSATQFRTFESICINVTSQNEIIRLACVYRPSGHPTKDFFSELTIFFEEISLDKNRLIVAGDFNIHVDKVSDPSVRNLSEILSSFGLTQYVDFPTHTSGHCLDLIITKQDDSLIHRPTIGCLFLDHFTVICNLKIKNENFEKKRLLTRNIRDINIDAFKQDIEEKH